MIAIILGILNLALTSCVLGHLVLRGRPLKSLFNSKGRVGGVIQVESPVRTPPATRAPAPEFPMTFRAQGNEALVSYYRSKTDLDAAPFIAKHLKKSDQYVDEMGRTYVGDSFREQFQPAAIAEVRRLTPGVAKAINRDVLLSADVVSDPISGVTFDDAPTDAL